MNFRTALLAFAALAVSGAAPALAKDCGAPDAPPGVRVPKPLGCESSRKAVPRPKASPEVRASREPGFIDLGNGSQIRIGGRVRVDGLTRH